MTTLLMSAVLIFGIMSYRRLPVSDLPNVDFPTLQVSALLPGASPETMAGSVATPLEREFSTIAGLDSMTSTSFLGATQITIQFTLDRNIDAASQDVQAAIARAAVNLPRDMPSPPIYRKVNPADQPVLYLALTSPTLPLYQLNDYADTMLAQRISMITGVAQVSVFGSQKFAVRVQVNPDQLAARGIGLDEVASAIQSANVNLPTGVFDGKHQSATVDVNGQLMNAAAYHDVIVTYRNGNPVRLHEIGHVIDSVENDKIAAWFKDRRGLVLAIQRQPGTNTVEVVDSVNALLKRVQGDLPASIGVEVLYDRSESIRDSVDDVKFTLALTLALVVMVIFLFLRNVSATVIPSIAMPMSLVGTFAVMYLLNFSVDNLSLMAMTLSVGFVVDDAIVVLENIVRHIEKGEPVFQAALKGSQEIGFTVVSMTLSLAAVFIPIIFMGGILGRLLSEFAITIGAAILISGFVSLTLTPMLCSRFLKAHHGPVKHGRFYEISERFFTGMLNIYDVSLQWVIRHARLTLAGSAVILAATIYLFVVMPKGFFPSEDTGRLLIQTEANEDISFGSMIAHQQQIAAIVLADDRVESYMSTIGARGNTAASTNTGVLFARLKPRSQRNASADEIIEEWRPKMAAIPGIRCFIQNIPPIIIGGRLAKSQYQYTLQGPDTAELYRLTPQLADRLKPLPGFQDVSTDLQLKNPKIKVEMDRDKLSAMQVTAEQVEMALGSAYGQRQVSTIYGTNNQYQVILEVEREYQHNPAALSLLHVRSADGHLIPIEALAKITQTVGPLSVNHLGQLPAVTISFNLAPGYALGPAVEQVQRISREVLPATITGTFQGTAQAFQSSQQGLQALLIVSIVVIYLVLGILYESYIHPITILTALPFAGFGALLTLVVFGIDLNLYAFVGIIMLVGLVKKNGIMMVDFAIDAQKGGSRPDEAIYAACLVRFRPIMMTTMAALMGTLPIALGFGAGAESRRPLGLAVVGGLLFSQSLTLYVTPVFYIYAERMRMAFARRKAKKRGLTEEQFAAELEEEVPAEPSMEIATLRV